ncbi:MAG: phosphoglycerate dehydrogenase [Candidatus Acetothermia bacterium]|jgi:D-3-phosphoglycerate dehydrogenase|nr:phosphoglycerate dehydrogenase [Candidatus Acetothermia bacterium]MDH7506072.1 hydroxyacid dehydrogenase [Candidatus Acetothermia bacterium]
MKILVSDSIVEAGVQRLREAGFEVEVKTGLKPEELIRVIPEYDGLIVRSATKVTREVIQAGKNLKAIGRAGIGLDNIDTEAAKERGIRVLNTPEATTISVAELTIGHMLALARHIPQATASLKAGKWEKKLFMGTELYGKTLGIIGLGRIGREVAKRASAFGMDLVAYDPYVREGDVRDLGLKLLPLEDLLRYSDYITIHVPLTPETKHILGKRQFELMKPGVRIINCARGGVIDEQALYEALVSGKVAGAALDVFEEEPPKDNPLLKLDNVIGTPHLGASAEEGQERAGVEIAAKLISALS